MDPLDVFMQALERSLHERYEQCQDFAATPSSILLAVLNAVNEARQEVHSKKAG
jgi:hypothetical protein